MKRASRVLFLLGLVVGPAWAGGGQEPVPAGRLTLSVEDFELRNGLRVLLAVDGRLPLVTVAVGYGAGTIRERPGQAGLAYLFENLMFHGSENVGPLQHLGFIQKVGGDLNATTTVDKALYYQTLPSNYLALALWLESDRMKSLAITPAAIERTRSEVVEEHRNRLLADPTLPSFMEFDALVFPDFAYGHPLIGAADDMMGLSESAIEGFRRTYYIPNNAVLAIVGDFDPARTRELVVRYFDSIPPGPGVPAPPRPEFKRESEAVVRRTELGESGSGFHMGFRFYPIQPAELNALRILEVLLFEGETARLRNRLLRKDRASNQLSVALDERPRMAALKIFSLNTNALMVERAERVILSELEKLRTNAVSVEELDKAKSRYKLGYLDRLSTLQGKALYLIDAAFGRADLAAPGRDLDEAMAIEPSALVALVSKFFTPQNRVVLEFGPR